MSQGQGGGQPTKFNDKIKKQIQFLAEKGMTLNEMAEGVGITEQTIGNWSRKYPKFFASVKDWKYEADRKVEKSLYERACGYSCPEDKIFNNNGVALVVPTTKHYPPDPTAMIFWLKNRQPENWRDKQELQHTLSADQAAKLLGAFDSDYRQAVIAELQKKETQKALPSP